jgi:type II secretory pathway pseudopilin PulG
MKDFMEKLYSMQYFGVVLFSIIGILAVLFVIVLILALKDAKKRRQAENLTKESDQSASMADVAFAEEVHDPVKVEVTKTSEETPKEDNVVQYQEAANNTFEDIKVEAPSELPKEENVSPFPDLEITQPVNLPADIMNDAEKEEIAPVIKETEEETVKVEEEKKDSANNEEPVLKPQQPEQFSSIYVTPGAIPNKETDEKVMPTEMPNLSDIPAPTPVRVVNESSIVDSSAKKELKPEDISTDKIANAAEEYTIK